MGHYGWHRRGIKTLTRAHYSYRSISKWLHLGVIHALHTTALLVSIFRISSCKCCFCGVMQMWHITLTVCMHCDSDLKTCVDCLYVLVIPCHHLSISLYCHIDLWYWILLLNFFVTLTWPHDTVCNFVLLTCQMTDWALCVVIEPQMTL